MNYDRTKDRALAETRASVELHCGLAQVSRRLLALAGAAERSGPWTPTRLAWASGVAHTLAAVSLGIVKRNVRSGRNELLRELNDVADGAPSPTPLLDLEWASALGCGGPVVRLTDGAALARAARKLEEWNEVAAMPACELCKHHHLDRSGNWGCAWCSCGHRDGCECDGCKGRRLTGE